MSQIQGPHMNARNGAAIPKYLFFHLATWSTSTTLKFQNLAPAHVVQQSLEWPLPHIGSQRCFDPKNKLLEAVEECLSNHEGGGAAMMSACNTVWVWSQKFSYWVLPLSRSSPGELVTFPLHIGTTSEAEVNTEEVRLQLNLIFLVGNKYVFYCFFSTVLRNTHSHLHQKSHRGLLINEPTSLSHSHSQNNLGFNPSSLGAVFGNRWAQNTFKLCQHHIREGFCWGCIEKPVLKGLLKVISSLVLSILALKLLCLRRPHRKYRNRL